MGIDGKKTYGAAVGLIVAGITAWATGDATWWQGLLVILGGGLVVGVRSALAKMPEVLAVQLVKVFAEVAASAPTTETKTEEK